MIARDMKQRLNGCDGWTRSFLLDTLFGLVRKSTPRLCPAKHGVVGKGKGDGENGVV